MVELGDSEVHDLRCPVIIDKDVGGFQVTMNEALGQSVRERGQNGAADPGVKVIPTMKHRGFEVREQVAIQPFEHHVRRVVARIKVDDLHDVGMIERVER